jgi:amino acid adenylation domain-containing protein
MLMSNDRDPDLPNDILTTDFPSLFEAQVGKKPDAEAVCFEQQSIRYADLNRWANQIADYLVKAGVEREQRVGMCLDRSIEAIATMLGVMKSGAAFVPLDPEFPVDRLEFIVADAGIELILCDEKYEPLFAGKAKMLEPQEALRDDSLSTENPGTALAGDQLAYIMYTSGSTGKPKGVQIEHLSLVAYCDADVDVYQLVESDRTLQFSTLNFDIAIEEIFPPLMMGSCVVVRPRGRSSAANELSSITEAHNVTAIHLATAYWHEWVDLMVATGARVPASIRLMVVTGEKVSAEHYRRWLTVCDQEVLWCNAYGPTEATVTSTVFIPPVGWKGDNLPIGKPLKRYDALILDGELNPVATGETGELYIGGPALARGYLNRPDLTEKAFVSLPIQGEITRLYKSGDIARWLPTGDIEFGGRVDHQIKLGSYRIEPGEIEAAIHKHAAVLESLVSYDEIEGKKYLIAYVAIGANDLTAADLAAHLRDQLPPYMVPSRYVFLANFPKTINGKIDRQTLPPAASSEVPRARDLRVATTELEKQLVSIWSQVLNVPELGIDDDFFALGGSSLLVTRVIAQVSQSLDVELPVRDFFANPTIALIAAHIESLMAGAAVPQPSSNAASRALRATLPTIAPCFFESGKQSLFGVHYAPVASKKRNHAVLICQSYGHEYARAYRNLQQLAVFLAKQGFDVFRFDYSGTGNSGGDCDTADPRRWKNDTTAAAAHIRSLAGVEKLSVVGLRLGATLASVAQLIDLESLLLWDPVCDGNGFLAMLGGLHESLLAELNVTGNSGHETAQAYGYAMTATKRHRLAELEFGQESRLPCPTTVITSRGYTDVEPNFSLPPDCEVKTTSDEIYWHAHEFTNRAFSSPQAFESISQSLSGATR